MLEDRSAFVAAFGFAFEGSPWVAEAAWERGPFRDRADALAAMIALVRNAPVERKTALLAAHPELGGAAARAGRLTPESRDEQAAAGVDRLAERDTRRFATLNEAYRRRFGFPFVICAREHDKRSILAALERRLTNEPAAERETGIEEVFKIARLRLENTGAG